VRNSAQEEQESIKKKERTPDNMHQVCDLASLVMPRPAPRIYEIIHSMKGRANDEIIQFDDYIVERITNKVS